MSNDRLLKKQREVNSKYSGIGLLFLIILLGAFLTYYPHISYSLPLHIDEWYHIYMGEYFAQHGMLPDYNIYLREFPYPDLESGFHAFIALVYLAFHPSIPQWTYLPMIIDVLAILSVFAFVYKLFGRNEAFIAAFLVALFPSNVTVGGPVFLIPANFSLIFIPLGLLFAFDLLKLKPIYNYAAVFLVTTLMLYVHPPSAVVLVTIIGLYALANLFWNKAERKHSISLLVVLLISALASIPNYLPYLQAKAGLGALSFSFPVYANQIPYIYGFIPTIFFIIGLYILSYHRDSRTVSILLTSLFLLFVIFMFTNFNVNFLIPYQRTYIPLFLLMGVIASRGYAKILELKKFWKYSGIALFAVIIALTAYFSIMNDINTPYYHIISVQQYQNFMWIKGNLNNNATVIIDPWLADAFGPVAEMKVYSDISFVPNNAVYVSLVNNTDSFFASGCRDTGFLRENNISIVYSNVTCDNSNLTEVHNSTYILK